MTRKEILERYEAEFGAATDSMLYSIQDVMRREIRKRKEMKP